MKIVDGMNYREWQKRNSKLFKSLDKAQQKAAREQGYYNVGWAKVQSSWEIISKFDRNNVTSLFARKLSQGKVSEALSLSILEAEQAKKLARETLEEMKETQEKLNRRVERVLEKYQPL